MIASRYSLENMHREYCMIYWELNELQLCWSDTASYWSEYHRLMDRMNYLTKRLGYTPNP